MGQIGSCSDGAELPQELGAWLADSWSGRGRVLVLTGAGVSAESGIPTFRGEEGYWKIGSREYFPEELATFAAYREMPEQIWGWYLYRRSVCRAAHPSPGHLALAALERAQSEAARGDDFLLLTQNVDGLHLRAGNSSRRTYEIHGNIDFMRCVAHCGAAIAPLPAALGDRWERGRVPGEAQMALLRCSGCAGPTRPHVLWFDEAYDEQHFHFNSSLAAVQRASLCFVIGTSGATHLPSMVVQSAVRDHIPLLVLNRDPSPFSELAEQASPGFFVQGAASVLLPPLVECLLGGESV